MLAIADEETIANLDKYKGYLNSLTDPRKTTDAQAQADHQDGQAGYWITSGMHSPESGGPEMLMELAYRLVVEETPFIQGIRNNVITLITPVIEVDGREKYVDNHYFNEKWAKDHGTAARRWRSRRRSAVAHVLGQVRPARQQPRRHGSVPRPHEEHDEDVPRLDADGAARSARGADVSLFVDRHGPVQRRARSDRRRRVVDAGEERRAWK